MNMPDLNDWAALWQTSMLRACWQGALAVVGVWVICRLVPRLPPALRAGLWWLACLKTVLSLAVAGPLRLAVLPAEPPLAAPALTLPAAASTATNRSSFGEAHITDATIPALASSTVKPPPAAIEGVLPDRSETVSPVAVVLCLWIAGVSFLSLVTYRQLQGVRRLARQAQLCNETTAVQARDMARTLGLRHMPPILISESADCSLVIGPWRPVVLLCRADVERMSPEEMRSLLAHELAHVRRHDLWAGLLPNLARLLFFFNPLVWLACREYDLAREAACDAVALRVSGMPPAAYGRLLLKLSIAATVAGTRRSPVAALGAASPYGVLLRRRLRGLQGLGSGSPAMPRSRAALTLAAAVAALSFSPVRGGAGPIDNGAPTPPAHQRAVQPARSDTGVYTATAAAAARETSALPALLPSQAVIAAAVSPVTRGNVPAASDVSGSAPNNKKEELIMSNLSNPRKPKLPATLAVAAALAAVGTPAALTAAAQEAPAVPAAPAVDPAAAPRVNPTPGAPAADPAAAPRYQYTVRLGGLAQGLVRDNGGGVHQGRSVTIRYHSYINRVKDRAIAEAQKVLARSQPGDCIVVDYNGKRYLITDADTLRRVRENYTPVDAIGKQREALGKQMEEGGKPMEALGKQMEALGERMEAIGEQMEEQGKLLEAAYKENKESEQQAIKGRMRSLRAEMAAVQAEMVSLSQKMRGQGAKMRPQGNQRVFEINRAFA